MTLFIIYLFIIQLLTHLASFNRRIISAEKDKVTIAQQETIPNIWNGTILLTLTDL